MKLARASFVVLALAALLAAVGCGDDPATQKGIDDIVGTWAYGSATVGGAAADLDTLLRFAPTSVKAELTINSNGTFNYEEKDTSDAVTRTRSGTFDVNGQDYTMRTDMEDGSPITPETEKGVWATTGDTRLTLTTSRSGTAVIFFLDRPQPPATLPTELVATWLFASASVDFQATPLATVLEWQATTVKAEITLNQDATSVYQEKDAQDGVTWEETGSFTVSGQDFTLTVTEVNGNPVTPEETRGQWQVSGTAPPVLSLTFTNDQGQFVILLADKQ